MKRKRFSVEQIVEIMKQAEVRVPVVELCQRAGITERAVVNMEPAPVRLCSLDGLSASLEDWSIDCSHLTT